MRVPVLPGRATALFLPQLTRLLVGWVPSAFGHLLLAAVPLNLPDPRKRLHLGWDPGDLFADTWLDQATAIPVYAPFLSCVFNLGSLSCPHSLPLVFRRTTSYGLDPAHRLTPGIATSLLGTSPRAQTGGGCAAVGVACTSYTHFDLPTIHAIRWLASRLPAPSSHDAMTTRPP